MRKISAFKIIATTVVAASVVTLSACGGGSSASSSAGAESGDLNIIAYAGVWQEQYEEAVIKPFEEKYPDITVNYVSKRSSAEMLSALQGQQSAPATDVSIMDISVSTSGNSQGLFEKVDESMVPNLANVDEQFLNADGYGPAVGVDAIGLLYDTQAIPETPTSWNILWDPQYAGKINVMAPPSLIGISLTAITASMLGEDYTQSIDQATAKLQELAPNVQSFAPNPDEYQSVITGQTVLGLGQNGRGQYYSEQSGGKMGVVFPEEGTALQINTINLVKDAPNPEAAKTFMDYALSSEAQSAFASALFYAPTVSNADVPADVAARIVPTDGSLKIIPLDVEFLAANRDAWTDIWKREIIGQ